MKQEKTNGRIKRKAARRDVRSGNSAGARRSSAAKSNSSVRSLRSDKNRTAAGREELRRQKIRGLKKMFSDWSKAAKKKWNSMKKQKFFAIRAFLALGALALLLVLGLTFYRTQVMASQSRTLAEIEDFPESYREGLTAVKEAIPGAQFILFDVDVTWDEMFEKDNLMYFSRQLIENYPSYPSSWKDTTYWPGSYNYETDDWVVLSSPNWVQASEEIVKYFADPRNFLNEVNVFMFEQESYNEEVHTLEGVEEILKGTFMDPENGKTVLVPADSEIGNKEEKEYTYPELLYEIGKTLKISPYLLATRLRQEQGEVKSQLIQEEKDEKWTDYEGYYNYFNIMAAGETYDDIYENGFKEAVEEGWSSPYLAIYGGSGKLANNYIKSGKDTLYLQKFNLTVSPYGTVRYYGYMQALLAPYSESIKTHKAYSEDGSLETGTFVFVIPVFKDMPEEPCPKPEQDGNPNPMLKKLIVTNSDGEYLFRNGFAGLKKSKNFSTVVYYGTESVNIAMMRCSDTAVVTINDQVVSGETGLFTITEPLKEGANKFKIVVTAENGATQEYNVNIKRLTEAESTIPKLSSEDYHLDSTKMTLSKVDTLTKYGNFIKRFSVSDGSVKVFDASGKEVEEDGTVITTGMQMKLYSLDGKVYQSYQIIIYGDADGDGDIDVYDMLSTKRHMLGVKTLSEPYLSAANADGDEDVDVYDMLAMKRHILDVKPIEQR